MTHLDYSTDALLDKLEWAGKKLARQRREIEVLATRARRCQQRLFEESRRRATAEDRIEELEGELATLASARARTHVLDVSEPLRFRSDDHRKSLTLQALRARLAKTDMSPRARLRTLQRALHAQLPLTDDQLDELHDLEEDLDVGS